MNGLRISITTLNTEMNTNCERNLYSCLQSASALYLTLATKPTEETEKKKHISPEKDQVNYIIEIYATRQRLNQTSAANHKPNGKANQILLSSHRI